MAIAFRAAATGTATSSGPTVTAPTGLTDGDLVLIIFGMNDVVTQGGSPTLNGFTILGTIQATNGGGGGANVLYKIASSEGASWTFTGLWSASTVFAYASLAFSGVDGTTPINQYAQNEPAASTTPTSSQITPSVNDCMIVGLFGGDAAVATSGTADTSPAATEAAELESGGGGHVYSEYYLQGSAAAVDLDFTATNSTAYGISIVALTPSGGAPPAVVSSSRILLLGVQ